MGNPEIKLLSVEEELKMHESQSWDTRKMEDGKRFLKVVSNNPLTSVLNLMQAFQPTEKEFVEAAILDQFTLSWQGDLLSASRSSNPQVFFRRIIDQIQIRKQKLSKLAKTSGNLIMLLKIYMSLSGIGYIIKDQTVTNNLQWLKQLIISMRLSFFFWHISSHKTLLTPQCVYFHDKFVKQKTDDSSRDVHELRSKIMVHILKVLNNWDEFLLSQTKRVLKKGSKQIQKMKQFDVDNTNEWSELGAIIV